MGVNKNTVLRVLHLVRKEGLLEFCRGHGITVAGTPEKSALLAEVGTQAPAEVLFKEARQRRRRRWILGLATLVVIAATGVGVAIVAPGQQAPVGTTVAVCRADQLSIRFVNAGVGLGHVFEELGFVNKSTHRCRMEGYPKVQMLTLSGGNLPTTDDTGLFTTVPRKTVVLQRDSMVYFALYFSDGTGYDMLVCPRSAALQVTPPDNTSVIVFNGSGAQIAPYGGSIQLLHCGEIYVSPVTYARRIIV